MMKGFASPGRPQKAPGDMAIPGEKALMTCCEWEVYIGEEGYVRDIGGEGRGWVGVYGWFWFWLLLGL